MGNHNLKSIIKDGTVENVKEYLSHEQAMKDHVFRYGWTPTHLAVEYHKLDILKYLVEEAKADVRHVDNALSNLLHHALHFAEEHFDIVKYLLESGLFKFDNTKDEHENTTLHLAFQYCTLKQIAELNKYYKGHKDIFQEKNNHGMTPLALLKERCKNSPESLVIVEQLQEQIEKAGSDDEKQGGGSKHNSGDEGKGGLKNSQKGRGSLSTSKGGSKQGGSSGGEGEGNNLKSSKHKKKSSGDHEQKEETIDETESHKKKKKNLKDSTSSDKPSSPSDDGGKDSANGSKKKKHSKKKEKEGEAKAD